MKIIAIDGPAGAGKSTIARLLAEKLDFLYIDSGALYRALTWYSLKMDVDFSDDESIIKSCIDCSLDMDSQGKELKIFLNGEEISRFIRTKKVSKYVSIIARLSPLRKKVVEVLRRFKHDNGIVMDGRDIGTVVFPNADFKFFLTATPEERAKRRVLELNERGENADFEEILLDIKERDHKDKNRADSPLKIVEGSILIDSTSLNREEVVDRLIEYVD